MQVLIDPFIGCFAVKACPADLNLLAKSKNPDPPGGLQEYLAHKKMPRPPRTPPCALMRVCEQAALAMQSAPRTPQGYLAHKKEHPPRNLQ